MELTERRWIGYDNRSSVYINRGWHYLRTVIGDVSTTGYLISSRHIVDFKALAIASTYDQLIASQQHRRWLIDRERKKKGTSVQTGLQSEGYYPIANKAYASIFGMSEATASRYRSIACAGGFIEMQPHYIPLKIDPGTKVNKELMAKYSGEALVFRGNSYFIQSITHVRTRMIRKRIVSLDEKNMKAYRKGISKGKTK